MMKKYKVNYDYAADVWMDEIGSGTAKNYYTDMTREETNGEWVKYDDVKHLIDQQMTEEKARIEQLSGASQNPV